MVRLPVRAALTSLCGAGDHIRQQQRERAAHVRCITGARAALVFCWVIGCLAGEEDTTPKLEVLRACFGTDTIRLDVTEKVKTYLVRSKALIFHVRSDALGADPAPTSVSGRAAASPALQRAR